MHLKNGAPPKSLLKTQVVVERNEKEGVVVRVKDSAIFSTWIGLKKTLDPLMKEPRTILDLSDTFLVDHTVMAKLQEMEKVFKENGSTLVIAGLRSTSAIIKSSSRSEEKTEEVRNLFKRTPTV